MQHHAVRTTAAGTAALVIATVIVLLTPFAALAGEMEPVSLEVAEVAALASGISFQGKLNDGGVPVTDVTDFQFKLFDASVAGVQVGGTVLVGDHSVVNGLFTVELNFGNGLFGGADRWIEIGVRDGASIGVYTLLSPRTKLTATPHSLALPNVFTDPSTNFVGVGRNFRISGNEVFGMRHVGSPNQYGGMYVETSDATGWPFYGYATNGSFRAWSYFQGDSAFWRLYMAGSRLTVKNGGTFEIHNVISPSSDGIRINDTPDDGIQIGTGTDYPNYGVYIPSPGVSTFGLWPNTANASGEWALYTVDFIQAGNVAAGTFSVVARAGGETPLEIGDVAAVTGVGDAIPGGHHPLPLVRTADGAKYTGVIGVVEKRMVLETARGKEMEGEMALHSAPGPARDGDFVSLIVYGIAQVKVDPAAKIEVGQRLTASDVSGRARALRAQTLNGMTVAEDAQSIGIALKAPTAGEETVPVFVTLK